MKYLLLVFTQFCCLALDNPHFYKASQFLYEPRLEEDYLSSFYTTISVGKSDIGLNKNGDSISTLDIFGPQDFKYIAQNIPETILNKNTGAIINNLWEKSSSYNFGKLFFNSEFSIVNANFYFAKNVTLGYFFDINLPVRTYSFSNISYSECQNTLIPNDIAPEWKNFVTNLAKNLEAYDLILCTNVENRGIGDLTIMFGRTINYEETTHLDFIDATIKAGILFPTGKQAKNNIVFDIPLGYDGFWGIPLCTSAAVGTFDWLTAGAYFNILSFIGKKKNIAIKTAENQSGQIKLLRDCAWVKRKPLVTFGIYLEAEHVPKNFSFFLGYQFNKQFRTNIIPSSISIDPIIANSDAELLGWVMHNINLFIEYDFSNYENPDRPYARIGVDIPFRGKLIIPTKMATFNLNFDIGCAF